MDVTLQSICEIHLKVSRQVLHLALLDQCSIALSVRSLHQFLKIFVDLLQVPLLILKMHLPIKLPVFDLNVWNIDRDDALNDNVEFVSFLPILDHIFTSLEFFKLERVQKNLEIFDRYFSILEELGLQQVLSNLQDLVRMPLIGRLP